MTSKPNKANIPATVEDKRLKNEEPDDGIKASTVLKVSVGVLGNAAMLYGSALSSLGKLSSLLDELNGSINKSPSYCKGAKPQPNSEDESLDPDPESCWNKLTLYKESKGDKELAGGETGLEQVKSLISLMEKLTKPASLNGCINPYFDQFFNAIPFQFLISYYIRELLKKLAGVLSETELQQLAREVDPCGAELTTILKQNSPDLDFPELFPLFKLPPIPLIPQINLHTILKNLIIELTCVGICAALTPLVRKLTKIMLEITDGLAESDTETRGSLSEFVDNSLEKMHLNNVIADFALEEAIRLHVAGGLVDAQKLAIGPAPSGATKNKLGLWKAPSKEENKKAYAALLVVIRQYFTSIFNFSKQYKRQKLNTEAKKYEFVDDTRELGTKELAYLMLGEYNCLTMIDLVEIGEREEFSALKLNTEKRIVAFFKFLAKYVNLFKEIEGLQSKECPADPCQVIDGQVRDEAKAYLAEICKVLNMSMGAPPIPVNNILSTLGVDKLFSQGIKAQFDQLKNDYMILLGFPSLQEYPKVTDLNPMLPKEHIPGRNTDYGAWSLLYEGQPNNIKMISTPFFKKYLMNGPEDMLGVPPLNWKYDNVDLSDKLKGQTLADICGNDEIFEVTYAHALFDIFGIDEVFMSKLEKQLDFKKKAYAKHYEAEVKKMIELRQSPPIDSIPCCKFKDFTHTRKTSFGSWDIANPGPGDSTNAAEAALVIKLHTLHNSTIGDDDEDLIYATVSSMTLEEKCYVCRRTAFVDGVSILGYYETYNDLNEDEVKIVKAHLNCPQFDTDVSKCSKE